MGDLRFDTPYTRVETAADRARAILAMSDEEVVAALAGASRAQEPYLANVLATEVMNRMRHKKVALESASEGLFVTDRNGICRYANPAACHMLGWSEEEILGLRLHDRIHHPPDKAIEATACEDYLSVRRGINLHVDDAEFWRADGTTLPVSWSAAPILMDNDVEGSVVVFMDITARKHAERLQAHLAAIVNSSDDAILSKSPQGIILSWNKGAERLYGYTEEEMIGQPVSLLVPPDKREEFPGIMAALRGGVRLEPFETQRITKDGRTLDISLTVSPIYDARGTLLGASAVGRDITSRKRATEHRLQNLEERYSLMVSSVRDYAMLMLDPEGHIITWNAGAAAIKGYAEEEILGKPFTIFYPPDVAASGHPQRELALAAEHGRYEEEGWRIRKDGSRFWANVVITALRDSHGRLQGYAKVTRDLTDRAEAERRIRDLNRELTARVAELSRSNEELEAFCYSVSHDLRAPLRGIEFFTRVLTEDMGDRLDEAAIGLLQRVQAESLRASALVTDILQIAEIGQRGLAPVEVDVTTLGRTLLANFAAAEPDREVTVEIEEGMRATADPSLLRQALENLLGNAWKYTRNRPDARITFGTSTTGGDRVFFVRDNGVGFSPLDSEKLFTAFRRLPSAEGFEGTGVGLAIVQRIIARHGGRIWGEGRPGEGATFFFTIG